MGTDENVMTQALIAFCSRKFWNCKILSDCKWKENLELVYAFCGVLKVKWFPTLFFLYNMNAAFQSQASGWYYIFIWHCFKGRTGSIGHITFSAIFRYKFLSVGFSVLEQCLLYTDNKINTFPCNNEPSLMYKTSFI